MADREAPLLEAALQRSHSRSEPAGPSAREAADSSTHAILSWAPTQHVLASTLRGADPGTRARVVRRLQRERGNAFVQRLMTGMRLEDETSELVDPGTESLAERIARASGGGEALEPAVRHQLEDGLGVGLDSVRVHADPEADALARAVDAIAFTTGTDIFFRQSAYEPRSQQGLHILAHEATHVVQQASGPVAGRLSSGGVYLSDPSDSYERAADLIAGQLMAHSRSSEAPPYQAASAARASIQRLTVEERAENLQSPRFAGNPRLEAAFDNSPAIHIGETNDGVRLVQESLVADGFPMPGSTKPSGEMDGGFAAETLSVIKQFQAENGLEVDGIVGRQTLAMLDQLELTRGSPEPPVIEQPSPCPSGTDLDENEAPDTFVGDVPVVMDVIGPGLPCEVPLECPSTIDTNPSDDTTPELPLETVQTFPVGAERPLSRGPITVQRDPQVTDKKTACKRVERTEPSRCPGGKCLGPRRTGGGASLQKPITISSVVLNPVGDESQDLFERLLHASPGAPPLPIKDLAAALVPLRPTATDPRELKRQVVQSPVFATFSFFTVIQPGNLRDIQAALNVIKAAVLERGSQPGVFKTAAPRVHGEQEQILLRIEELDKFMALEASGGADTSDATRTLRESVVSIAMSQVGGVQAKQGAGKDPADPKGRQFRVGHALLNEFFATAYGGDNQGYDTDLITHLPLVLDDSAGLGKDTWCGIFVLWALKSAGVSVGNWRRSQGIGMVGGLHQISPKDVGQLKPGDVGVQTFNSKGQQTNHHFIVAGVTNGSIFTVEGNTDNAASGTGGEVNTHVGQRHLDKSVWLRPDDFGP